MALPVQTASCRQSGSARTTPAAWGMQSASLGPGSCPRSSASASVSTPAGRLLWEALPQVMYGIEMERGRRPANYVRKAVSIFAGGCMRRGKRLAQWCLLPSEAWSLPAAAAASSCQWQATVWSMALYARVPSCPTSKHSAALSMHYRPILRPRMPWHTRLQGATTPMPCSRACWRSSWVRAPASSGWALRLAQRLPCICWLWKA